MRGSDRKVVAVPVTAFAENVAVRMRMDDDVRVLRPAVGKARDAALEVENFVRESSSGIGAPA